MSQLLLKGSIIGFAVAAPMGPIGLLILRRSLLEGRLAGIVSGLGAAVADTLCGAAAAFGLSALVSLIDAHFRALQLFGGAFLIVFGFLLFRSRPAGQPASRPLHERNLGIAFAGTLALTLINPMTLLGMVGICAGVGLGSAVTGAWSATLFVVGIFLGSTAWWLILCFFSSWLGKRLGPGHFRLINWVAGALLIGFGAFELVKALS